MKRILTLILFLMFITNVFGQYEIRRHTIDGGGGRSSGGPYTLNGTIGQPDAAYSSGSNFELLGGFWPGEPFCIVDFNQYAKFAEYWLEPCDELNNWCEGADLNQLDGVNRIDLGLFVEQWLCYCPTGWPLK
ncbi:MAG: hypothetical protein GWN30_30395 [Gammaproteobacteria bacterium]|nr:hypothetical protein [Gammaproteobacteria bacterium]